jgi:Flp pilus assembly protein CpaB
MEAHRHFGKLGLGGRSQGLSSRRNATLIALVSAVLAAVLIYLFVTHYNKSATPAAVAPVETTVWETTQSIPQGTPESAIVAGGFLKPTQVTTVAPGAIVDPSQIVGEVAAGPITAKSQITSADFVKAGTTTPANLSLAGANLTGNQRAVAFSFDSEHGLTTWLAAGDNVDIMLIKGEKSEMIEQNVPVLENDQGVVVLKLSDKQALLLTAATTQGSLWVSLRPAIGATNSVKIYSVGS